MAFLFKRHKNVVPSNATFRITQQGQEKLQDYTGDPKSQILVALESRGTLDMEELTQASGLSRGTVERLLTSLVKNGYVQYAGSPPSSEDL